MADYVHEISEEERARIERFLKLLGLGIGVFALVIVLLVATADRWLLLISPESEQRFVEPYLEWARGTLLFESEPELQTYVESLAASLYAPLGDAQPIRVHVVTGETINAFATLGGNIFVFEGLIAAVDDENSLAMVLAHEIAHVHHRDALLSTGRALLIQLAISTVTGGGIDPNSMDTSADVLLNQFSRDQELAADELALSLLEEHYGHVGGATTLFDVILGQEDVEVVEFLSTHPDTEARIEQITELSRANGWRSGEIRPYPDAVRDALAGR